MSIVSLLHVKVPYSGLCRVLQDSWGPRRTRRRNPSIRTRARRRPKTRESRSLRHLQGLAQNEHLPSGLRRQSRLRRPRPQSQVWPRLHDHRLLPGTRAAIEPRGHVRIALGAHGPGDVIRTADHGLVAAIGDDERKKPLVPVVLAAPRGMPSLASHRCLHRHHPQDRRGRAKAETRCFVPTVGLRSNQGEEHLA